MKRGGRAEGEGNGKRRGGGQRGERGGNESDGYAEEVGRVLVSPGNEVSVVTSPPGVEPR